jgi:glutamate/tyrosine decarboxylase-like PLP-dependent enzyme
MDQLTRRIKELQERSEVLEPTAAERDRLMAEVHRYAGQFIDHLPRSGTFAQQPVSEGSFDMDKDKEPLSNLLEVFDREINRNGIKPASGGHVGYIPGGGVYAAALGDYLSAVSNEYSGMHYASPGAVAMENELIDWMKELFGFPMEAIGNLTSGGSIANMIGLTAARDRYGVKNEKVVTSVIYLSPQVHHCVLKALRIIGLEDLVVRHLPLDEEHRILVSGLEEAVLKDRQQGLNPFCVIASAGTTDTGAIDPLHDIGTFCAEQNLWFHVDAAYGGFFMLVPDRKELFKGIELADSLVIDPHKGLFLPYGLGAVLVKDREAVFHSHHYTANYMQDALVDNIINPADVSPELTKHYRGLRMWFPLKIHGIAPFVACLEEKLLLIYQVAQVVGIPLRI